MMSELRVMRAVHDERAESYEDRLVKSLPWVPAFASAEAIGLRRSVHGWPEGTRAP